ncbi:MAG: ComF family protein [Chlamydiia bacterium]|nr:ComF family protein [Chlamydiia bacterium]
MPFTAVTAVFSYSGIAGTLVQMMKYGKRPELSKGAAGYLTARFLELGWPLPDMIVPVPIAWSHYLERGYNQSALLAREFGKMINVPVVDLLIRSSGDFSQAGLRRHQREALRRESVELKSTESVRGACVLLIDDVMTTGTTLQRCGEALVRGSPSSLYAMTLCRSF